MPRLLLGKRKFGLKIQLNAWGNAWILYHNTNKKITDGALFCCKALKKR